MADRAMQAAFVANSGEKPRTTVTQRRSVPRSSDKQQARTDVLTGVMAERIYRATSEHGFFRCECGFANCRRRWADPQFALNECDPHHLERRKGKRASDRARVFDSDDSPERIIVVSKACHRRLESAPQWSAP